MGKEVNKDSDIKAVVFDIGGVLLFGDKKVKYGHQNINVHQYLSKKFNLNLKEWFELIEKDYEKAITGEQSKNKILNSLSKKLNTSYERLEKLFVRAHKKYFRKNKELFRKAKKLNKKGYYVGILSDQTYFSKEALLNKDNLKYFNPVILSCDAGIRKPNKKIYKLFHKKMNELERTKYKQMLFIDNRDWNLKPAKELGMKTILFKDNKQAIKKLNKMLKTK